MYKFSSWLSGWKNFGVLLGSHAVCFRNSNFVFEGKSVNRTRAQDSRTKGSEEKVNILAGSQTDTPPLICVASEEGAAFSFRRSAKWIMPVAGWNLLKVSLIKSLNNESALEDSLRLEKAELCQQDKSIPYFRLKTNPSSPRLFICQQTLAFGPKHLRKDVVGPKRLNEYSSDVWHSEWAEEHAHWLIIDTVCHSKPSVEWCPQLAHLAQLGALATAKQPKAFVGGKCHGSSNAISTPSASGLHLQLPSPVQFLFLYLVVVLPQIPSLQANLLHRTTLKKNGKFLN